MPSPDLQKEAERQFTVCNACRYCEGYCAVFPAMERRRVFQPGDVEYLANLCHDCRDCYYACQYAPPHEFAINIPGLLSDVRSETYLGSPAAEHPRLPRGGVGRFLLVASLAALLGVALTALLQGLSPLLALHRGPGAFFSILPEWLLDLLFLALAGVWLAVWIGAGKRFWRATSPGGEPGGATPGALWRALADAFTLRYLSGGGQGCTYPAESPSGLRRIFHHLVFYGFLLDLAATMLAAVYDHVLGVPAPYPVWSPVVLLGSVGGLGILAGAAGLLWLKARSREALEAPSLRRLDVAFLIALLLVAATGFLLLALRSTALMGLLLIAHLATVAALFLTAPYGKFVHLVYRYASLVRYTLEAGPGAAVQAEDAGADVATESRAGHERLMR